MLSRLTARGASTTRSVKIRRLAALAAAVAIVVPVGQQSAWAVDLNVDQANGNNPLTFTGTTAYDTVRVAVSSVGTLTQNSGTLTTNTALIVATNANSTGTYNLGGTGVLNVVGLGTVGQSGFGTFNQNAGTATFNGGLTLSGATNGRGTYNLNGGTLTTSLVRGNLNGGLNSSFYFNGGTLRPTASSATFFQGLTAAYLRNGTTTIDTNGQNVTIAQALLHSNVSGDAAKDGGILKTGVGTLTLAGTSNYTGNTDVTAGTLAVTGSIGIPYQFAITPQSFFRLNGATTPVATLSGSGVIRSYTSAVGNGDKAIFNQSGGTHTVATTLSVGQSAFFDNSASNGAYNLSGGTLNPGDADVGDGGKGFFTQTGGTFGTRRLRVGVASSAQTVGTGTYTLGGTGVLTTSGTIVGSAAPGGFTQTAGTHTNDALYVGELAGAGTYGLSGTGLLTTKYEAIVGNAATGAFTHSASTFRAGQLILGAGGGTGTYALSGTGQLQIVGVAAAGTAPATAADEFISNGTFTQTGGTNSVTGRLSLGFGFNTAAANGSGTYAQSAGTVTSAQTVVGENGRGTFNQTGGTHTTSALTVAVTGGTGTYALGGTGTLTVNGNAQVGSTGVGTFNQTAGTNNVTGILYLGFPGTGSAATNGNGTYTLSGGSLTTNETQVANQGAGTFNQTGGTHTTTRFYMGLNAATATGTLSGTGQLNVNGYAVIGLSGPAVFTQSGGTATITNLLLLSAGPTGAGTYNLNGGTVSTTAVFGNTSGGTNAVFNFNGGTLKAGINNATFVTGLSVANLRNGGAIIDTNGFAVTIAQPLLHSTIGGDAAIDGGLTKNNSGTLTLNATSNYTGNTTVTGGTLAIAGGQIGVLNSSAALTVSGTASLSATASLAGTATLTNSVAYIGRTGSGTFNQTGGTQTVRTILYLGFPGGTTPVAASNGTYNLSAGTLQTNETQVANLGTGSFIQSGGTHNASQLTIGLNGSTGSYALSGTGQLTVTGGSAVGFVGRGTFTQTGGTHSAGSLLVGRVGATGIYNLSAGQLTTTTNAFVGNGGTGTVTQSGGSTNIAGILYLGFPGAGNPATTGNGTYNLSNGTLATAETQVGNTGAGTFNQTGGTLTTPRLFVGLTGGTGTYALGGTGQVNTTGNTAIGLGGPGTFNQTAGTATFAGALFLSAGANGVGTYNLNGGTLNARFITGNVNTGTNATFNFNGGTLRPTATDSDFIATLTAANVRNGGAKIDTNGINIGINQVLRHSTISGDAAVDGGLTKLGAGTLTLTAANTYTGTTTISAGTLQVKYAATGVSAASPLLFTGGTDLQNGRVVFDYTGSPTPAATIRSLLAASFNATTTPGVMDTSQFRSSTATAARGLGYADNGAGQITVMATLFGDADLDGGVSINDFNTLAANFGQAAGRVWSQGDFDYDGGVSINDFNLLASAFGQSVPASSAMWSGLLAFAAANNDLAAFEAVTGVPEPTTLGVLATAAAIGLRRKRKSSRESTH